MCCASSLRDISEEDQQLLLESRMGQAAGHIKDIKVRSALPRLPLTLSGFVQPAAQIISEMVNGRASKCNM